MIFITALSNLVPRGCDPFGLRQGSRLLARSNSGSSRFTDFPSLCAFSGSSLTNLIGFGLNLLCLQSHSKPECHWTWPGVLIFPAHDKRDPRLCVVFQLLPLRGKKFKHHPQNRIVPKMSDEYDLFYSSKSPGTCS